MTLLPVANENVDKIPCEDGLRPVALASNIISNAVRDTSLSYPMLPDI